MPPSRFIARLVVGILALNLMVAMLVALTLHESRKQTEEQAAVTVKNLARLLEHDLDASFDKIDLALLTVVDEVSHLRSSSGSLDAGALNVLIARQAARLPELTDLRMADAQGDLRYGTGLRPDILVNIADREHFIRQRDRPDAGLVVGMPTVSRMNGKWQIVMSRRLYQSDGSFAGTVAAVIELDKITAKFASLDIGRHGIITLRGAELGLIASYPAIQNDKYPIGGRTISRQFKEQLRTAPMAGTYQASSPIDRFDRTFSYRKVTSYPFYIIVGLSTDDYLGEWWKDVGKNGIFMAVFALVTLGFSWLTVGAWKRLQQQEQKFRTLLESSPNPLVIADAQGLITLVNRQVEVLFGFEPEELVGQPVEVLLPQRYRAGHVALRQGYIDAPQVREMGKDRLLWAVTKQGREIPVNVSLSPIQTEQGLMVAAAIRDITARRADEAKIKRLTELYAALNQCSQAIVRCTGEDELFPQICRAVVQFGGMKMAWVGMLDEASQRIKPVASYGTGTEYLEGIEISVKADEPSGRGGAGTAIRENRLALVQDFQNDPRHTPWHERGARAGWGSTAALPLLREGKVIGVFAVYAGEANAFDDTICSLLAELATNINNAMDIYSLQAERKQTEDALLKSEQRFRDFSRSTADWFWEMDADLRFTYFSDNFERYYGLDRNRVLGKTRRALMATDNLNPPDIMEAHLTQIERHEPFRDFHYCIRNGAGHIGWFSISGVPVFDPNGQFAGYRGMGQNVTERKQAEEELRVAAAAFESQEGMMITDAHSVILRVNRAFTETTGYTAEEAVGQTPRLLQSGRHDKAFFAEMWETIQRTGGWQGEIWDRRKNGKIYPKWLTITAVKSDLGAVTHYVGAHTDITARKTADEQIAFLAYHDPLTGLPNRLLLLDRLQQALAASARSARHGALLFLDLDNFKTLNDTLGHDKGDLLLKQVAQRLASCVREGDTVARLGGDEFVVMFAGLSEQPEEAATQTETLGEKILATLNQPYLLAGHETRSTPSIGVTLFSGQQTAIEELMKQADLAMYQSKTAGRNTLRFFDPQMQAIVTDRAALEADLREAVKQQQFILHYQPQGGDDGGLTGAEALVRWQHPQRGRVSPAEFIPLAEETNLILPLGLWVLETACAQLARWADQPNMADLSLAVNVSANQLQQADFVDQVLAVLKTTGANPHRLKLELTESLLVSNVETTIAKMSALKAHGVGFALDDFGTGYSSLSYLKRLPLDQLKIDQGFVRDILIDPNDAAIARMVIVLAGSLGLAVMAEGVETEEQRDALAHLGCHAYQGYLFSRPLPLPEFEAFAGRV